MATLIASAKLTNAFRVRVVDKNISANLTATFTIGHRTIVNGEPLVYGNDPFALPLKIKLAACDLTASFVLANTMRYATKGGGNVTNDGYFVTGQSYKICQVGDSVWNTIAGTTGVTYSLSNGVGNVEEFVANNNGVFPVLTGAAPAEGQPDLRNPVAKTGKASLASWTVRSTVVCEFPTYIEIDIEALMLQGLPEGTDCVLNFQEGWQLEDRGRLLPSGAYEYGTNIQNAPSPEFPSFVTFRTPKFFRSAFSSVFSLPTRTALRIKQLQSTVASASTVFAFGILNPGKLAALVAGVSQMVSVARKTVRGASDLSSIVTTVVNSTRARLFNADVSSQFTLPPIDFWYRRLGVSVMSSTATISAAVIRNIGPIIAYLDAAGTEQGFAFTSTANRTARITKNLSSIVSFSVTPTATQGIISLPMSMTASLSANVEVPMILTSTDSLVQLPLWYGSINAVIDWGDGTTQTVTSTPGSKTSLVKNYGTSGTRTIYIRGFVQNWGYQNASQFLSNPSSTTAGFGYQIEALGDIGIQTLIALRSSSGAGGFTPKSIPSTVLDISYFFYRAKDLAAGGIDNISRLGNWNTSNIQKMEGVFRLAGDITAAPITGWNTGSVTTMSKMFNNCRFNSNINGWNVSNVQDFSEMFRDAEIFNQDLSSWNVSSGTNFQYMFSFTNVYVSGTAVGPGYNGKLYNWNLISATSPTALENMLYTGFPYTEDLRSWCVPNVASRPTNFAVNNYAGYATKEPVWGTCP